MSRRCWAIVVLALLITSCAAPHTQRRTAAGDQPTASVTAVAAVAATAGAAPTDWHTLYTRPDFDATHSVDLRAVGDISLARNVDPVVRRRTSSWLLEPTAALLNGDVVIGNLESPLTRTRRPDALRPGPYRLPADPALVDRLAQFDALSLANNHALDAGASGLAEAQHVLQQAKILPLGVTGGDCGSTAPTTIDGAVPLHLLAFNAVSDPQDRADEAQSCGRAWLDEAALAQISRLRDTTTAPIVVLVHWGEEYASTPNEQQRTWARRLVAAGADLIVGAHPHVVQPAEPIEAEGRRGFVAYSLGNFVFDQPEQPATSHSVVLHVQLDQQGVGSVAVAPVVMRNTQPVPLALDDPAAQTQLAAIAPAGSAQHGWRWDGSTFADVAVPAGTTIPPTTAALTADLRGNAQPLRATLRDGLAQLWDGDREVWRNENEQWQVSGMTAGDADNDGRYEILLRLWKPDNDGVLRSHPFLLGWRGGYYRVFWGGSAVAQPIQDAAIGTLDGRRNALVVLEGGRQPGDAATHVGVWTWQGWNFQQQWQSPAGSYRRLALIDLDGDGAQEIVAE